MNQSPRRPDHDEGRAIIEVIWLVVLVLIPVVYILIAVIRVQSTSFATAQAAREAARLLDVAPSAAVGHQRAVEAATLVLIDQNVPTEGLQVSYRASGTGCDGPQVQPTLEAGATFDVCVRAPLIIPLLPEGLTASNSVSSAFTLHVGEFRESR